jgi:hypothetical protein
LINRFKQTLGHCHPLWGTRRHYVAMIHIGMILLWLKPFAGTPWTPGWEVNAERPQPL